MASLKSNRVELAELLDMTPDALYERQRSLLRAKLLKQTKGRGPGSGVRLTPASVALLLIAILAAENLPEIGERSRQISAARAKRGQCPFTRQPTFLGALSAVLSSAELAKGVAKVTVSRTQSEAEILYAFAGPGASAAGVSRPSNFGAGARSKRAVTVSATLEGETIRKIAEFIATHTDSVTKRADLEK